VDLAVLSADDSSGFLLTAREHSAERLQVEARRWIGLNGSESPDRDLLVGSLSAAWRDTDEQGLDTVTGWMTTPRVSWLVTFFIVSAASSRVAHHSLPYYLLTISA
jgi:hypothetical protein